MTQESISPFCKMCGATSKKMARAHIIPRAFHKKTLKKHNYLRFKLIPRDGSQYIRQSFGGVQDQSILCQECEGILISSPMIRLVLCGELGFFEA